MFLNFIHIFKSKFIDMSVTSSVDYISDIKPTTMFVSVTWSNDAPSRRQCTFTSTAARVRVHLDYPGSARLQALLQEFSYTVITRALNFTLELTWHSQKWKFCNLCATATHLLIWCFELPSLSYVQILFCLLCYWLFLCSLFVKFNKKHALLGCSLSFKISRVIEGLCSTFS